MILYTSQNFLQKLAFEPFNIEDETIWKGSNIFHAIISSFTTYQTERIPALGKNPHH